MNTNTDIYFDVCKSAKSGKWFAEIRDTATQNVLKTTTEVADRDQAIRNGQSALRQLRKEAAAATDLALAS